MALSLAEAAKLSNDIVLQGVIETIVKDSPILQRMPFIEIVGNGLTYNREATLGSAAWYTIEDTWAESTGTFDQITAVLKILGGDADVDNYIKSTRSNIQDIEAAVLEMKAKAVRHAFEEAFIYGTTSNYGGVSGNPKTFDGLRRLIGVAGANSQVVTMGGTGGALTLAKLEELIDVVRGGKPDMLLMSRRSRRSLNALIRASGTMMQVERDQWGNFVELYNGIPIAVSDFILDTHVLTAGYETAITGGNCSIIFALCFGEGAIAGLTSPGGLTVETIGSLETKDATRTRIKWYCAIADFSLVKRGALIGVQ